MRSTERRAQAEEVSIVEPGVVWCIWTQVYEEALVPGVEGIVIPNVHSSS